MSVILDQNSVKSVKILVTTKIIKEIKFEGMRGELESIKGFQRNSAKFSFFVLRLY